MNVGGHRLSNDELRSHFQAIGFEQVATFRASGNVVFDGGADSDEALRERIEQGFGQRSDTRSRRSSAPPRRCARSPSHEPFAREQLADSRGKLQVALLGAAPTREVREQVLLARGRAATGSPSTPVSCTGYRAAACSSRGST